MIRSIKSSRDEAGSMAVEVAILAPLVLLLMLFLASLGRVVEANAQVQGAARDAARSASLERTANAGDAAADAAARLNLGARCPNGLTTTRVSGDFTPGTLVRYRVRCVFPLPGASAIRLPSVKTLTSDAVTPVETFRRSG